MPDRNFLKEHFVLILGVMLPLVLILFFSLAKMITEKSVEPPTYKAVYAQTEYGPPGKFSYLFDGNGKLQVSYTGNQPYPGQQTPVAPAVAKTNIMVFDAANNTHQKYQLSTNEGSNPVVTPISVTGPLAEMTFVAGNIAPDGYTYTNDQYNYNAGLFSDIFGYGRYYDNRYVIGNKGRAYLLPLTHQYIEPEFIGWAK